MNNTTSTFKRADTPAGSPTRFARELSSPLATPRPQPSLRIPVTRRNREYLRALRAAEAAAWENAVALPPRP